MEVIRSTYYIDDDGLYTLWLNLLIFALKSIDIGVL